MRGGTWAGAGIRVGGLGHHLPRRRVVEPWRPAGVGAAPDGTALDGDGVGEDGAGEDETIVLTAARALEQALRNAGREPGELGLLVLSGWTSARGEPEAGPRVAARIGADRALAFDVGGACAGFVLAVQTAAAHLVAVRRARCAAVVCSEHLSRHARPGRGAAGAVAGAAVLEFGPPDAPGLIDSVLHSDGRYAEAVAAVEQRGWLRAGPPPAGPSVDGTVAVTEELLDRNGLRMDDIDWLVPHPGPAGPHAAIREKLGIRPERFLVHDAARGGSCAAALPCALSESSRQGRFGTGDLFLVPAAGPGRFGGGLLFRM
jgi:3-oxoacyl-[acyl-carrier-protein] synthase III